jgi:hypothetical protein
VVCLFSLFTDHQLSATHIAEALAYIAWDSLRAVTTYEALPEEKIDRYPSAYVVQCPSYGVVTEEEKQLQRHWILVYFVSEKKGLFYDSLGLHPDCYNMRGFLERNCDSFEYNRTKHQSYDSYLCGAFVIFVLFFLVASFEFESVLNLLHYKDYGFNDNLCRTVYTHITTVATVRYERMMKDDFHRSQNVTDCDGATCQYCVCIDKEYPQSLKKGF